MCAAVTAVPASARLAPLLLALLAACAPPPGTGGAAGGSSTAGGAGTAGGSPSDAGPDTSAPWPIDRTDGGAMAPTTYQGLALRLVDNGEPVVTAVNGVIGVVCIGMSNASQECVDFIDKRTTTFASEVNAAVRVVNCALSGNAIERWNDPARDGPLWTACIDAKLPDAGLTVDQVRVVYHKAANQFTTAADGGALPLYPAAGSDYDAFVANLTTFAGRLAQKLPAVQAVYTTSRSYGGFSTMPARGEPLSYEEGHALNTWLSTHSNVGGVWYGWGPYVWAPDCATGTTNGSGVCYVRNDYVADGIHPGNGAQNKISLMIHRRFRQHAWYRP